MRVAICFYGLIGSKSAKGGAASEPLDPSIAFELYKEHVFDKNENVDIFIHSWSVEHEESLLKLYKPKKFTFQDQIEFPESSNKTYMKRSFLSKINFFVGSILKTKKYKEMKNHNEKACFRSYSRWYSSQRVLELKKLYEEEHDFKYDVVMVTRLDVGFFKDLIFSDFDMNYFYASHRNTPPWREINGRPGPDYNNNYKDKEFSDFWFFSRSQTMDTFSKVFDELNNHDEVSPHISSKTHVDRFIGSDKIKYVFYRWFDHEMIRRKYFDSKE
jgi:hypothetical protein